MEIDLKRAKEIALELREVKPNELERVFTYLRANNMAKTKKMISSFINNPYFRRSGKTKGYYKDIKRVLDRYKFSNEKKALWTLGWAMRLMRYYR